MIVGSGIDLIENERVERELARGAWQSQDGVFTESEILFCNRQKQSALLYAMCFAAKEAALKALGSEVAVLSRFREVELLPESRCRFILNLHGHTQALSKALGVKRTSVAVTSSVKFSGAVVVLES